MNQVNNISASQRYDKRWLLLLIGAFLALIAFGALRGDYSETLSNGTSF